MLCTPVSLSFKLPLKMKHLDMKTHNHIYHGLFQNKIYFILPQNLFQYFVCLGLFHDLAPISIASMSPHFVVHMHLKNIDFEFCWLFWCKMIFSCEPSIHGWSSSYILFDCPKYLCVHYLQRSICFTSGMYLMFHNGLFLEEYFYSKSFLYSLEK